MNWDAIGAVGEIIGAVAVVVSLAYLAMQIRQNSRIVAANTFQSISTTASKETMEIAQNPSLASLIVKMTTEPPELTSTEAMQAQLLLRAIFRNYENHYYQHSRGYFEDEVWDGYVKTMGEQLAGRFGRTWWESHQGAFGKSFVAFVNEELIGSGELSDPWMQTQRVIEAQQGSKDGETSNVPPKSSGN